jgi:hypothetical protein
VKAAQGDMPNLIFMAKKDDFKVLLRAPVS